MKHKRNRVTLSFEGEVSRTKQAFKDECDINNIIKKHTKGLAVTHTNSIQGKYGDFSNVNDYHAALNSVMDANEKFMALPAALRAKFQNDPAQLIQYVSNDANYEEAISLGLIETSKAQAYFDAKAKKSQTPPQTPTL